MNRIVIAFYEFFKARRSLFYSILVILFIILGYFSSKITLQKDITKMIPDDAETIGYKSAIQNIRILDKIIVSFEADSAGMEDSLIACAEKFVADFKADSSASRLVTDIRYRIDEERMAGVYDLIYSNLPIYLTPEDYTHIDSITTEDAVKESIERSYHKLISPASLVLKQFVLKDPLSISTSAFVKLQGMQAEENFELHDGYIFRKNKKTLVLFLSPVHAPNNTERNGVLIDAIDKTLAGITKQYPQLDGTYFGAAAVAVANARQIESDIKVIATAAMVIILGFLFFFYRSWSLPILMITPVLFGGVFSLGVIYFIQGTISAIAIGAGSVIIGIALDYSFHVFAHYQHTRNIKSVVSDVAVPMMIGSVSTVGAFFSLLYVHSDILSDFGLFAGLCLIGASVFSLFFLPHLIETFAKAPVDGSLGSQRKAESFLLKLIARKTETNKWFVAAVLILTVVFIYYSNRVTFDSDLSQINYMPDGLKAAENKLYQSDTTRGKSVFFIFRGKDMSEALYRNEQALGIIDKLKEENHIHRYAGISGLLPSDSLQLQRIAYWNAYWTPEKIAQVQGYIIRYSVELGFNANAFNPFFESLATKHAVMNAAHRTFMQDVFLKDYVQTDSNGVAVLASMRVPTAMSDDIYSAFDGIEGLTILDRQLFYNKFLLIVKDDFNQILMSSSILVFMILLISYGRLELTLISFLPMVISWFWILGLMGIFDIHFNIVNIIISTFVFGLGDDYSIFITDGLQKKYAEGKDNLPSYKVSIFLSAFTTIVAMGALIFAKHPALKSIALISIIGIACVLLISYTIIPLLFRWFITDRTDKGKAPLTLVTLVRSLFVLIWSLLLFILLVILKNICLTVSVFGKSAIRKFYKFVLYRITKMMLFCTFFLSKKGTPLLGDFYNNPRVILSSNQSVLNYLFLLSLHPRLVFLFSARDALTTLEKIIHYVSDIQIEHYIDEGNAEVGIRTTIKDGYSPIVFDTNVYIQKILNANIEAVSVVIAGTELSIRKDDFVFNRARVYVYYSPLLQGSAADKLKSYYTAVKVVHEELKMNTYFNKVLSSYIYKGPVLEWYFRIKVQLEQSYQVFKDLLPEKGVIYDLGCGYGFLDYFLLLQSDHRTIIGVDYDEDKIQVADQSYLKNDRITFEAKDVMAVDVHNADAVMILDVLHYLSVENQHALIRSSFQGLKSGGILIIRDGDSSQESKHNGTKLTEFFSTKLLKFNKQTEQDLCFTSSKTIIDTLSDFNVEVKVVDTTVYTSNIVYYVVKP